MPEALEQAEAKGLDLVEVAPNAKPPVCKIMDYGKYLYEEKKKSQEAKKRQTQIQVKEIKFRPHTDDHDLMTKIKHIRRFIEDGDRCKVTVFSVAAKWRTRIEGRSFWTGSWRWSPMSPRSSRPPESKAGPCFSCWQGFPRNKLPLPPYLEKFPATLAGGSSIAGRSRGHSSLFEEELCQR